MSLRDSTPRPSANEAVGRNGHSRESSPRHPLDFGVGLGENMTERGFSGSEMKSRPRYPRSSPHASTRTERPSRRRSNGRHTAKRASFAMQPGPA